MKKYELTVGIEVHAELSTKTKIFCPCPTTFGALPNTQICPVCMGLPGTLPTLNRYAVEYAIKAGLATNCKISKLSGIDRKNYYYPDLPKGYQISQHDRPICHEGYVDIECNGSRFRIGIERIHIEEDAGKLIHGKDGKTLVDYNRCGIPLIEIVSKPNIHSPDQARAYLKKLRSILRTIQISDCKMNEGSLRCDVNVSINDKTKNRPGERTEIKNLNSFSHAAKAIEYEYNRQCALLENNEKIIRQTLRYNDLSGKCEIMRSKESVLDYRYCSEPDLQDIFLTDDDISRISSQMPPLPDERKAAYIKMGLPDSDAELLSSNIELSDYFNRAEKLTDNKKTLSNLILTELLRLSDEEDFCCPIVPENLATLCDIFANERINSSTAKKLLQLMWNDPTANPEEVVQREGLWQINETNILLQLVKEVLQTNQKAINDFKNGKVSAMKSIIGKVMSASKGRANPRIVEELIRKEANLS